MRPLRTVLKRLVKVTVSCVYYAGVVAFRAVLMRYPGRGRGLKIVLAYHGVSDCEVERFAAQMDQLLNAGDVTDLEESSVGARNALCVTFDDALESFNRNALPVLRQRGIPSTVFVPAGNIGERPKWNVNEDFPYGNDRVMTAQELAVLDKEFVSIGSHTITHVDLAKLSDEDALAELSGSKAQLEALVGYEVSCLAFPYGSYNAGTCAMAEKAGYRHAYSIEPSNVARDSMGFIVGRIRVEPSDWRLETWLKLRGAYGWLACRKMCRPRARVSC